MFPHKCVRRLRIGIGDRVRDIQIDGVEKVPVRRLVRARPLSFSGEKHMQRVDADRRRLFPPGGCGEQAKRGEIANALIERSPQRI